MKYSFIIPVKAINDYIRESVPKILRIARDDYEIIVYPDRKNREEWPKTKQIATGHCGPATKRSRAIDEAKGEILVFIDDDAYPAPDFLDRLDKNFSNPKILAVGGPAVTPPDDSFWQKVSGAVFLSRLSGGNPERYVSLGKKRLVKDWPSVNFSIRRETFKELNGFCSEFWPGEDTKLCLDLIKKNPKGILYDPQLIAFHHRRTGLLKHLKQVAGYGLHRGFFAKKYPETSFKPRYFVPTLFLGFIIFGGLFGLWNEKFLPLYFLGWLAYAVALLLALIDILKYEKLTIALHALYYIFLTHLVYGWNFFRGYCLTKDLKSKLR